MEKSALSADIHKGLLQVALAAMEGANGELRHKSFEFGSKGGGGHLQKVRTHHFHIRRHGVAHAREDRQSHRTEGADEDE